VTDSKLLDSSVWIEYLISNELSNLIESESHFALSSLSIFEIKKKFLKDKIEKEKIKEIIKFVKNKSIIILPNSEISEKAAELSLQYNLGAIDALIYATSLVNNSELLTLDNDFRDLEKVKVLE
jgi:predicted nucleic acid-binding protein